MVILRVPEALPLSKVTWYYLLDIREMLPRTASSTSNCRRLLYLPNQQILDHLPSRNVHRLPQCRHIERAACQVSQPKCHHGRDPASCILQCKATLRHAILLNLAAVQVVYVAGTVDFGIVAAERVGALLST